MMERSHRRLEERLADLQSAAGAIVRERAGLAELALVDEVIAYLERSAARHEADEEESLFPRLRGDRDIAPLLADLTAEHAHHRHLIGQLRALRSTWPPAGPAAADGATLAIAITELSRAYRSHITREEEELLPAARGRLTPAEIASITAEMHRRRGGPDAGRARGQDRGAGGGMGLRRRPAGSGGRRLRQV